MCDLFHGKDLWVDPIDSEAKKGAVLLSDQIAFYAKKVKMISPFDPNSIRPASYLLHVGSEYYIDETPQLLNNGGEITIPENGLVYIQTREWLNIPYYLIARYNLEVRQLYRGFLLDDGLQIDPGYHGHFYCPVHNLTNQEKKLKHGDPFIAIDFVRTSPLAATNKIVLDSIDDEEELLDQDILGVGGNPIRLFAKNRKELIFQDRKVHDYWFPGEKHSSSMHKLQEKIERLESIEFPKHKDDIRSEFNSLSARFDNSEKTTTESIKEFKNITEQRTDRLRNYSVLGLVGLFIAICAIMFPCINSNRDLIADTNAKYELLELGDKGFSEIMEEIQRLQKSYEVFRTSTKKFEDETRSLNVRLNQLADYWEKKNERIESKLKQSEEENSRLQNKINEIE